MNAFKKTVTICIVSCLNPVCVFSFFLFPPGGFAKVKLGRHILTGEKVAIKIMNKKDLGVRNETGKYRKNRAVKTKKYRSVYKISETIITSCCIQK